MCLSNIQREPICSAWLCCLLWSARAARESRGPTNSCCMSFLQWPASFSSAVPDNGDWPHSQKASGRFCRARLHAKPADTAIL